MSDDARTQAAGPSHLSAGRRGPLRLVPVDNELVWIASAPVAESAAARPACTNSLIRLRALLAAELAAASGGGAAAAEAALIDAAARVVADYLEDLPDLPLIGEPFGGQEGTD